MSCELDKIEICHISNCIINVRGQKSNSDSPTDVWFLDFNDTTYKNKEVKSAF